MEVYNFDQHHGFKGGCLSKDVSLCVNVFYHILENILQYYTLAAHSKYVLLYSLLHIFNALMWHE